MIKLKFPLLLITGIAGLAMLQACSSGEKDTDERLPYTVSDSLFRTLSVDTVKQKVVTNAIKLNGMVDYNAEKTVTVFPLVTGNVQGVNIAVGDFVKAGQVLAVVKSAEVANFNAAPVAAQATVRQTARQLAQQKDLYKSGLASEVDITNAETAYDQAVAAQVAAQKVLSINGNNRQGEYMIKAPVSGFIVQMNLASGMAIRSDNNTGLLTIADLNNVWVQANVYEQNISKVHQGDSVTVTTASYPDKIFNGRVDKLMDVLDANTKAMKMRIVLSNPDYLLKPQMFATVTLSDKEKRQAPAISSKALVFDNSQYYVLVLKDKKDIQIRPVTLLSNNGQTAYIASGLQTGERVIASNVLLIYGSLNN